MSGVYGPRHSAPYAGQIDFAAERRRERDRKIIIPDAVRLLAATEDFEPSRVAYRELHRAGVLTPRLVPSIPATELIGRYELDGAA